MLTAKTKLEMPVMMTSRERLLTALDNGHPDRLPCQVHGWMDYYLENYLGGCDWWEAYARFDMDYAIYVSPVYTFGEKDRASWVSKTRELGTNEDGNRNFVTTITTPLGVLTTRTGCNAITTWTTEPLIKTQQDFELWETYCPLPTGVDLKPVHAAYDRLGDHGVIRSHPYYPGQGSPWQAFCTMVDTQEAIFMAMDEPEFVHHALNVLLQRCLKVTAMWEGTPADMVETDGGAGSSTVISPALFETFCLPYDRIQNAAFQALGLKTVCHLCGGIMPMLDLVAQTGTNGLETMTPTAMGGDCDLTSASARVGDRLFFIGGFDQNAGFEQNRPEVARKLVFDCFEATRDHAGYILCPSDHFFYGDPACLQAFADAAKECVY